MNFKIIRRAVWITGFALFSNLSIALQPVEENEAAGVYEIVFSQVANGAASSSADVYSVEDTVTLVNSTNPVTQENAQYALTNSLDFDEDETEPPGTPEPALPSGSGICQWLIY